MPAVRICHQEKPYADSATYLVGWHQSYRLRRDVKLRQVEGRANYGASWSEHGTSSPVVYTYSWGTRSSCEQGDNQQSAVGNCLCQKCEVTKPTEKHSCGKITSSSPLGLDIRADHPFEMIARTSPAYEC